MSHSTRLDPVFNTNGETCIKRWALPEFSPSAAKISHQRLDTVTQIPDPELVDKELWRKALTYLLDRARDFNRETAQPAPAGRYRRRRYVRMPIPELRGLIATKGIVVILGALAEYAGRDGAGAFVSNRRLAAQVGMSEGYVRLVRRLARAAGLLVRTNHGAPFSGARDVLAWPGGTAGLTAFLARRQTELATGRGRRNTKNPKPWSVTLSPAAADLLKAHPELGSLICRELATEDHQVPGRVLTVILSRIRAPRRIRNWSGYVRRTVRRDFEYFRTLVEPHNSDQTPDVQVLINKLSQGFSLDPP